MFNDNKNSLGAKTGGINSFGEEPFYDNKNSLGAKT